MKQVLIIISIVLCSSVVLAQTSEAPSSVYDVPANKIKPDYDANQTDKSQHPFSSAERKQKHLQHTFYAALRDALKNCM